MYSALDMNRLRCDFTTQIFFLPHYSAMLFLYCYCRYHTLSAIVSEYRLTSNLLLHRFDIISVYLILLITLSPSYYISIGHIIPYYFFSHKFFISISHLNSYYFL